MPQIKKNPHRPSPFGCVQMYDVLIVCDAAYEDARNTKHCDDKGNSDEKGRARCNEVCMAVVEPAEDTFQAVGRTGRDDIWRNRVIEI